MKLIYWSLLTRPKLQNIKDIYYGCNLIHLLHIQSGYNTNMICDEQIVALNITQLHKDIIKRWELPNFLCKIFFWELDFRRRRLLSPVVIIVELCQDDLYVLVISISDVWGMQCFCSVVSKMVSEHDHQALHPPNIWITDHNYVLWPQKMSVWPFESLTQQQQ